MKLAPIALERVKNLKSNEKLICKDEHYLFAVDS